MWAGGWGGWVGGCLVGCLVGLLVGCLVSLLVGWGWLVVGWVGLVRQALPLCALTVFFVSFLVRSLA